MSYFSITSNRVVLYTFLVEYLYTLQYDQYRRLYLQFCVLLMMGVVDTRNM